MLDIGWSEFFVIGVIALVVIGPRELPAALRSLGQIISRARSLAQDFRDGLDDIARETEVKNITNNMLGDLDDKSDDEWLEVVNAGKLEKTQTPIDSDEAKAVESDASAEPPINDLDEEAFDAADAAEVELAAEKKPKDAQS
ncbi:MAG: twin-arginine translocase subunit TatB [Alphaproteobacteria bacterium]|jgi:sec-independent protein translocase protein TatB|nr:twin-arginine translocase subunit TatB [Alphaproteobacteria bacterium]